MTVLAGLRVIEVSASGAAAMATKQLADWGASVTVLEPEGGTPLRGQPPFYDRQGERRSASWAWLSRGKQTLTVPPAVALKSVLASDVAVVESELCEEVLGVPAASLRGVLESKTTCVLIGPFATDGPYAGYRATDLGIHALGGWVNLIGDPEREPLRPGYDMIPRLEGVCAFVASLLALRMRDKGATPQFVDLSGQAVAATMTVAPWLVKGILGIEQNRKANDWLQGGMMETVDGWFGCTPLTATHWEMMCQMLGLTDVLDIPGGREPEYRWAHSQELLARVRPFLYSTSKHELFRQAQEWRIPAAPVEDVRERLDCPQLAARGFFQQTEIDGEMVKTPRVAFSILGVSPAVREPVQEGIQRVWDAGANAVAGGGPAQLPFNGVRVLDLTHFWAGPYATSLLGAMGADVIKVESVQRPDAFRYAFAPAGEEAWWERSPLWNDTNCNKRGITLDLGSDEGRALFERLVRESDVVVNNFSNRVMANLGLSAERLHEINPGIINVAIPGYGPGGPWENYVGFGIAFEQLAVCASITGYEGDVPRIMSGFCDPLAGLHAVAAIELALRLRERTGTGQTVEVPQCETLDSLFAPEHISVQLGGPVPSRRGNRHEWMAPHNTYRAAGQDRWISIAVGSNEEFRALSAVLGAVELAQDARFATPSARKMNEPALDVAVARLTSGRDGLQLEKTLQAAGVMACRVAKGWELPSDPNLAHINFFQPLTREFLAEQPYKAWPFRFSGIATGHRRPAPLLGEHNREVLGGLLGVTDDALASLASKSVIGTRPMGA